MDTWTPTQRAATLLRSERRIMRITCQGCGRLVWVTNLDGVAPPRTCSMLCGEALRAVTAAQREMGG